jgi:hypothetical protein
MLRGDIDDAAAASKRLRDASSTLIAQFADTCAQLAVTCIQFADTCDQLGEALAHNGTLRGSVGDAPDVTDAAAATHEAGLGPLQGVVDGIMHAERDAASAPQVDERVDDLSTAGEGAAGGMRPSSSAGVRCESSLKVDEVEFCAAAPAAARPLTAPIVGAQRAESVEVQLPTICAHEAKLEVTRAGPRATEIDQGAVANASVSCDRAMINALPVELLEHILLMLPAPALWSGWNRVCRHWSRVMMGCVPIKRRMQNERWLAYEARVIVPQVVLQADERVFALCAGPDIIVCSASSHHYNWRVWSDKSGALEALQIALRTRTMVAIGQHNQIYVWAHLCNIEVWSRSSGALLQTLVGHTGAVCALAVDRVHGNVYSDGLSRSHNSCVVWSRRYPSADSRGPHGRSPRTRHRWERQRLLGVE